MKLRSQSDASTSSSSHSSPEAKGSCSSSSAVEPSPEKEPADKPDNAAPTSSNSSSSNRPIRSKASATLSSLFSWIAWAVLWTMHVALALLILVTFLSYILKVIHDDYFSTLMERALRTDHDLLSENTYYQRQCNVLDITATKETSHKLYIHPGTDGVNQMMQHGAVLFPHVLNETMVSELRQFIVEKNVAVKGTSAEFPMSESYQRVSYGIEATEDPRVVRTLKAIHDNKELERLLVGLVGPNPALTEITAITAGYGAESQNWHSDVKADGNGVMFGRTYSHSYSLFIPLQNTTGAMGATDICPGTHYCADDLSVVCDENKIGMDQVGSDGHWKAGDGALYNQQIWHRGPQHTAKDAQDRAVFIISFIGRPNDSRQLARGTYFHMKWNMWGHTWDDLEDAMAWMRRPFCILRCLHIWKNKSRQWGYDLMTAVALRVGNSQLGCEPGDLASLLRKLDDLGFPEWLDGTIDLSSRQAWQMYFRETIQNVWNYLFERAVYGTGALLVLLVVFALPQRQTRRGFFSSNIKRFVLTCGIACLIGAWILIGVRRSPWAVQIASGETLMRPFPELKESDINYRDITAVPHRGDVLAGSRMNVRTLGAYSKWIDFHPGNIVFRQTVADTSAAYRFTARNLPRQVSQQIVQSVIHKTTDKGLAFLAQDHLSGDWIMMPDQEVEAFVQRKLEIGENTLSSFLKREMDFLIGDSRFVIRRTTALSAMSISFLVALESNLFGDKENSPKRALQPKAIRKIVPAFRPRDRLSTTPHVTAEGQRGAIGQAESTFNTNQEVLYSIDAKSSPVQATIMKKNGEGNYSIAIYGDEAYETGSILQDVRETQLSKWERLVSGVPVLGNYEELGEWHPGTIVRVHPNGAVDILYFDGDFEVMVHPEQFDWRFLRNHKAGPMNSVDGPYDAHHESHTHYHNIYQ